MTATIFVTNLSSAQSETVHELRKAFNEFNASTVLSKEKHWNVVTKFVELQMEFPVVASMSKAYFDSVEAPEEESTMEGYNEPLFWLFLSLRAFSKSQNAEDFNKVKPFLHKYLLELSAFSEGSSSSQVLVQLVGTSLPGER